MTWTIREDQDLFSFDGVALNLVGDNFKFLDDCIEAHVRKAVKILISYPDLLAGFDCVLHVLFGCIDVL